MARRDPILTILCIAGVLALEGILLPGPIAAETPSPFSLESGTAPKQAVPQANDPGQTAPASPFALPPKTDQPPAPSPAASNSPLALPPSGQPAVDNPGVQTGLYAVSPAAGESSAAQLLAQGLELAREGKLEEARVTLEQALAKDPKNVVALNNLGLVLRKLERLDGALDAYQKALQIDGTYALTYKNLGVLREKRGENELAIQAYREYSRLAPAAPDAKDVAARADWLAKNSPRNRR